MKCPNCNYCGPAVREEPLKKRIGFFKNKDAFVKTYSGLIGEWGITPYVLRLARKKLKYSPKTLDCDIKSSLERAYRKAGQY